MRCWLPSVSEDCESHSVGAGYEVIAWGGVGEQISRHSDLLLLLCLPLLLVLLLSVTRHARSKLTITTLLNATLQSNVPAQKKKLRAAGGTLRGLRRDRVCRCAGGRGLSLRGNAPVMQEDATCMSLQAVGLACAWLSSCARRRIARSARWPRNVLNQKVHTFHGWGGGGGKNLFFDAIFSRQSCFSKNVMF